MIEVVFVGRKSAYVVAVAVALHRADWVKLKARGRAVGKAVDVARFHSTSSILRGSFQKVANRQKGDGLVRLHLS